MSNLYLFNMFRSVLFILVDRSWSFGKLHPMHVERLKVHRLCRGRIHSSSDMRENDLAPFEVVIQILCDTCLVRSLLQRF